MFILTILCGLIFGGIFSCFLGIFGLILGYIFGGGLLRFCIDSLYHKHSPKKFFQRNRVVLASIVFQIVGGCLLGQLASWMFGTDGVGIFCFFIAGIYGGDWLNEQLMQKLDWETPDVSFTIGLGLVKLADISKSMTVKDTEEIEKILGVLYGDEGFGENAIRRIYQKITDVHKKMDATFEDVVELVKEHEGMEEPFIKSCLCLTYASSFQQKEKMERIVQACNRFGKCHHLLPFYDFSFVSEDKNSEEEYHLALKELGLKPNATLEMIKAAYTKSVEPYHPEKMKDLPPQILELAKTKIRRLNTAYKILTSRTLSLTPSMPAPGDLEFLHPTAGKAGTPPFLQDFECACYLCSRKNYVKSADARLTARCEICHALLGKIKTK